MSAGNDRCPQCDCARAEHGECPKCSGHPFADLFGVDRNAPTRFEMPSPKRSLRHRFMAAVHAFWEAWHS